MRGFAPGKKGMDQGRGFGPGKKGIDQGRRNWSGEGDGSGGEGMGERVWVKGKYVNLG